MWWAVTWAVAAPSIHYIPLDDADALESCFYDHFNQTIYDEGSKIKGVTAYIAEDLGGLYLHKQANKYTKKVQDVRKADVVVLNSLPILSASAGLCNNKRHRVRQRIFFRTLNKFKNILMSKKVVYPCTSWSCRKALTRTEADFLFEINATILINELNGQWVPGHSNVLQSVFYGIPVPYSIHHGLVQSTILLPKKNVVFFAGGLRRDKIRPKINKLKDHPMMNVQISSIDNQNRKNHIDEYVEATRTSLFCLVPRGDTPTSRRLFDAIVGGCLPVIISDDIDIHLPFASIVPYGKFVYRVSEKMWLQNATQCIESLLREDRSVLLTKRVTMKRYASYVDWRQPDKMLNLILDDVVNDRSRSIDQLLYK